jgi:hypothetical protein
MTQFQEELETKKRLSSDRSLFTSLFFATLTNAEMNRRFLICLYTTIIAERMTDLLISGMINNKSDSDINACPGSEVEFRRTTSSVLCYCGKKFTRRFNGNKPIWSIPIHNREESTKCG